MNKAFVFFFLAALVSASIFDFFQDQFQGNAQKHDPSYEQRVLDHDCNEYLCPDTLKCVQNAGQCPCPFPSSQLRCPLTNGKYICISKPAGDFHGKYDDPEKNWKVDAKDNNVRDCGWVKRAWAGKI